MELPIEIQELFVKFEGGDYEYTNNGRTLKMSDFYGDSTLDVNNGKKFASFWYSDDNILRCHILDENKNYVEGDIELVNAKILMDIFIFIIECKHYLEENGFDKIEYRKIVEERYKKTIESDLFSSEYEKMKRIYEDKNYKLYWVD